MQQIFLYILANFNMQQRVATITTTSMTSNKLFKIFILLTLHSRLTRVVVVVMVVHVDVAVAIAVAVVDTDRHVILIYLRF